GFRNLEMVQQRRDVVAHCGEAHWPVRVRGAAVALHFHRDHLPGLRQRVHPSLHLVNRRQATMDKHQRFALAVDLAIELDAVHISVAAAGWFHPPRPPDVARLISLTDLGRRTKWHMTTACVPLDWRPSSLPVATRQLP